MPITKRQFELRIDHEIEDWMRQIYRFLADHKELAYSLPELLETLVGKPQGLTVGDIAKRDKFKRALEALLEISVAEARDVTGTPYYAFYREVDTLTWERKAPQVPQAMM